jgi:hypothetical protein
MMQNLTSTLIISSMFFVTYAHIWISKLVISRKSLALPLVTYASCQIVAAAVPAAAFWVSNSILFLSAGKICLSSRMIFDL